MAGRQAAIGYEMGQRTFSWFGIAVQKKRDVPAIAQPSVEYGYMSGGAADIQPSDHAHDVQWARTNHRQ